VNILIMKNLMTSNSITYGIFKNLARKSVPHLIAVILFLVITLAYFYPVLEGKSLFQSDITQYRGMAREIVDFREETGKEALWTNSMFGGMPAYLISVSYPYNLIRYVDRLLSLGLPRPAKFLFLSMLGFYIGDELGGKQLDGVFQYTGGGNFSSVPTSYTEAADQFTEGVHNFLRWQKPPFTYKVFTSDYALYWYDYKAGYDVVWTELGGNWSQQINIALCRGAAEAQGKEWGAIITWSYTQWPFIEDGEALYEDLLLAYDNGAKYIVIFDSDENGHSTLQAEHIDAMERFWNHMQTHEPQSSHPKSERCAYVIPDAYGFGFRWPTDHIWGIWHPDELTPNITKSVGTLLEQYDGKLDVLIDDGIDAGSLGYSKVFYWDSYDPTPTPTPSPPPTPSPTPTATPTPPPEQPNITLIAAVVIAGASAATAITVTFMYVKKTKR